VRPPPRRRVSLQSASRASLRARRLVPVEVSTVRAELPSTSFEPPAGRVITARGPAAPPRTPSAETSEATPAPADRIQRAALEATEAANVAEHGLVRTGPLAYVVHRDPSGQLHLASAWPLWALLVPFPLWWALGLGSFIFPLLAIPMAIELWRRKPVRVPRGFILWALFLVWTLLSLLMFSKNPSGVHPGSLLGRLLSTVVSLVEYFGVTITLLFVGNLSRKELPVHTLVRWLGMLFIVTVGGGILGTVMPHFGFTSPLEWILPKSLDNAYVRALVHPNAAQVQAVLGEGVSGRAAAPFGYTNFWANNISLLLIWFVCGWGLRTRLSRKVICVLVIALAVYPIAYSLNRGLWLGLAVTIVWVAVRLFLHGRVAALLAILVASALGAVILTLTPLHALYVDRLAHPHSNSVRGYLTAQAVRGAQESPVLGWGGSRKSNGSSRSIAVGKSASCAQCGEFPIGSNGQLWALLFNQGFVGTAFYLGFFGVSFWVYRRDRSLVGQAGLLVLALSLFYMLFYNSLPSALTITMISVGLLWRSHDERSVRVRARAPAPATARALAR
jgi:hypothetical protein